MTIAAWGVHARSHTPTAAAGLRMRHAPLEQQLAGGRSWASVLPRPLEAAVLQNDMHLYRCNEMAWGMQHL